MGTDIHPVIQVRRDDGVWVTLTKPCDGKRCYSDACDAVGHGLPSPDLLVNEPYHEGGDAWPVVTRRNYDVFAMLAGVRNGHGFAGVKTGDGFVPIASARGLPEDAGDLDPEKADLGDHSFSWVTLAELLAYDWTQETKVLTGTFYFNRPDERVEAVTTYAECVGLFLTQFIPALQKLGPPDDVRLVFGFDS